MQRLTSVSAILVFEDFSESIALTRRRDGYGMDAIPHFVAKLDEGFDLVQGSRYVRGGVAINTRSTVILPAG